MFCTKLPTGKKYNFVVSDHEHWATELFHFLGVISNQPGSQCDVKSGATTPDALSSESCLAGLKLTGLQSQKKKTIHQANE